MSGNPASRELACGCQNPLVVREFSDRHRQSWWQGRISFRDDRSYLQQENGPVLQYLCKDDRHAVHRPRWFTSEGHVLPQYAGYNTLSGTRICAFQEECYVLLCVGSEKNLKLFLDFSTTYPALSRGINELRILSEKRSQLFPVIPFESRKETVQRFDGSPARACPRLSAVRSRSLCQQLADCVRLEASLPQEPRS